MRMSLNQGSQEFSDLRTQISDVRISDPKVRRTGAAMAFGYLKCRIESIMACKGLYGPLGPYGMTGLVVS